VFLLYIHPPFWYAQGTAYSKNLQLFSVVLFLGNPPGELPARTREHCLRVSWRDRKIYAKKRFLDLPRKKNDEIEVTKVI